MASPAVTGTVALLLSEANARGQLLTSAQIRDKIITSARRDPQRGISGIQISDLEESRRERQWEALCRPRRLQAPSQSRSCFGQEKS